MNEKQFPYALWTEILPGLWQGGTDDYDIAGQSQFGKRPTKSNFDSVYTFYARANGADWGMKEVRFPFYDGNLSDIDVEADLWLSVQQAHLDWKSGKRVLIRCQAGLNRSGLVMALVLIREGYEPAAAIELIREKRGSDALCNPLFVEWLLSKAHLSYWQQDQAA